MNKFDFDLEKIDHKETFEKTDTIFRELTEEEILLVSGAKGHSVSASNTGGVW